MIDDLPGGSGTAVWSTPEWLATAESWMDSCLAESGISRTGPVEQPRVRPWAAVLTAPTSAGSVWMKACAPNTAFEAGLYELLHRVVPQRVLRPLGSDPARGWVLLPDGGTPLGERLDGQELVAAFAEVMPHYALLQRELAPHAAEMLDLGVVDMGPAALPDRFDAAVEAVRPRLARHGSADERAAFDRLPGMRDAVVARCAELADSPVPPSIDHNDLHPWNVLPGPDGTGIRFYDWGDAVLAHPFASALVALTTLRSTLGVTDQNHPALRRARDAYLSAFTDLADHDDLERTLELACHLGKIARTLTWHRAVSLGENDTTDEVDPDFADAPFHTLLALLDPDPFASS